MVLDEKHKLTSTANKSPNRMLSVMALPSQSDRIESGHDSYSILY